MNDAPDAELMVRASRLYYLEEKGQAEIAKLLRMSRPAVSRLLRRARLERIVEIRIRGGSGAGDWRGLEQRLGLEELLVAEHEGAEAVGSLAAAHFERTVRRGDVIGLTAGTTLSAFVGQVSPRRPLDLEIVPLAGAIWDTGEDFDGSFLCQELRRRTGGTHRVLSVPAVVKDAVLARSLRSEPRVRAVLKRYQALRCAFLGIGKASGDHPLLAAARKWNGAGGRGPRRPLLPARAVASVGCLFLDAAGRPCRGALDERTIGISHAELMAVPLRVGLAAGAGKLEAVQSVLRGRLLDVLIADPPLARALGKATLNP